MVKKWGFSILALGLILAYASSARSSALPGTAYEATPHDLAHQTVRPDPTRETAQLVKLFQADGIRVTTWTIHHGSLLERPLTDRQLAQLARYFQAAPNFKKSEQVFFSHWRRNISLEIRVIRRGYEKSDYVVAKMTAREQSAHLLSEAVAHVASGLSQAGIVPDLHVAVQGTTKHVLNPEEQKEWVQQAIETLDAYEVEALRDATMTSVSAFSPHFGSSILSNKQPINVQMAIRSDKFAGRTVFTMGTPIITIEY